MAAAATDVKKIQPLFYVFSHVCEWKRKSEKRGRKRRKSARTRRCVRRWTFETDRRKKRIIFSVSLSFFLS